MSERIGRYEILEELGKGGMGVVYRARDPQLERDVAIKLVLAWAQYDEDAMARFNRESRVIAQLQHPHIVTVFDAGRTEDDLPYFVMEFLEGTDLGELLGLHGTLPQARAARYAVQVCDGLAYAHAREIVHRDIKPANLLITPDDTLKIVDFGIAKLVGSQITGSGVSLGTPLYMAPEQVAGETVDHRADVFALGGVLYTLLAGAPPFDGPTLGAICYKIETEPPPALAEIGAQVHPELERIIQKALQKEPDRRYQSVAAMGGDLRGVLPELEKLESSALAPTVVTPKPFDRPTARPTQPIRRRRTRRPLAIAGVLAAVALLGFLIWPALTADSEEPGELAEIGATGAPPPGADGADDPAASGDEGPAGQPSGNDPLPADRAESSDPSVAAREADAAPDAGRPASSPRPDAAQAEDEASANRASRGDPTGTDPETGAGAEPGDAGERADAAWPDAAGGPANFYPASAVELASVNRIVSSLVDGLEKRDSGAVAGLFGGAIPAREWRILGRILGDRALPRPRIRYTLGQVGSTGTGLVAAEVEQDIIFRGRPGRTPAPRHVSWVLIFRSDDMGGLVLRRIQPR